ncbi:MAG: MBL fold metallo-hydrolase RNA specificity domain-containing protein, partial [Pseudomonadota bacterium]
LAPASALADKWARRLPDPLICGASGWMTVRQRAKQRGVELPLIISDHADWDELRQTVEEVDPETLWVTHGAEEALVHWRRSQGYEAAALSIAGRSDEGDA